MTQLCEEKKRGERSKTGEKGRGEERRERKEKSEKSEKGEREERRERERHLVSKYSRIIPENMIIMKFPTCSLLSLSLSYGEVRGGGRGDSESCWASPQLQLLTLLIPTEHSQEIRP